MATETTPRVRSETRPQGHPNRSARAVAVVAPAVVLVIGMVAAINLAIPELQASSLRPSVSQTAWIVDSYTLVFACLLIPAGALGDRFGRKRGILLGLGVFAVGSALAALAPSVGVLMAARAMSGVGAALVLPATLAVTLAKLEAGDRPHAVALWSACTGVGGAVGNLGGGLAIDLGSWRTLFWAGVPLALGAAALIASRVPHQSSHRDPVDAAGGLLLTIGTGALLFGIIEAPEHGWGSLEVVCSLALAVLVLAAFVLYELHASHPMLDPRLFELPGVRAGALGIVALFFALFGLFFINAQYLQNVKGFGPLLAGVCILPIAVTMPVASARSTGLAARLGTARVIVAGMLVVAAGLALLSLADAHTPYALYGVLLAVVGVGMGLAMPPLSGTMVHALPLDRAGVGSGLNSTTRELGSAFGVAVFATVLSSRFSEHLPSALKTVTGARGEAVRRSITAALSYAHSVPNSSETLVRGARDAFTDGTGLALRIGAALIVALAALAIHQLRASQERSTP